MSFDGIIEKSYFYIRFCHLIAFLSCPHLEENGKILSAFQKKKTFVFRYHKKSSFFIFAVLPNE